MNIAEICPRKGAKMRLRNDRIHEFRVLRTERNIERAEVQRAIDTKNKAARLTAKLIEGVTS